MPQLQVGNNIFDIGAANQVQPLLHLVFEDEPGVVAVTFGPKEEIEVEFVELAVDGNLPQFVGQLIGHHHHARQGGVGVWPVGTFHDALARCSSE